MLEISVRFYLPIKFYQTDCLSSWLSLKAVLFDYMCLLATGQLVLFMAENVPSNILRSPWPGGEPDMESISPAPILKNSKGIESSIRIESSII